MARVLVRDDNGERSIELQADATSFGRAPENTVVVGDKECSRRQFQIERCDAGFKLVDLESRNGTRVNGKLVNQHLLRPGDRVTSGKSSVTFEDPNFRESAVESNASSSLGPSTSTSTPVARKSEPEPRPERRSGHTTSFERIHEHTLRRPGSGAQLGGVIAAVFFFTVVALIVVGAATRSTGDKGVQELFDSAARYEASRPRDALDLYEKIPPSAGNLYTKARERAAALKLRIYGANTQFDPAEQAAYDGIVQFRRDRPGESTELVRQCDDFKRKFPQSQYVERIDGFRRDAFSGGGGTTGARPELAAINREIDIVLAINDFRSALAAIKRADEKYKLDIGLKPDIDKQFARVIEAGKKFSAERTSKGEKLAAEENVAGARKAYGEIIEQMGGVDEFSDQVRLAQLKLDALR